MLSPTTTKATVICVGRLSRCLSAVRAFRSSTEGRLANSRRNSRYLSRVCWPMLIRHCALTCRRVHQRPCAREGELIRGPSEIAAPRARRDVDEGRPRADLLPLLPSKRVGDDRHQTCWKRGWIRHTHLLRL